jgi:prepilin-type N-terminal cleavage/methylation domain-containing protein
MNSSLRRRLQEGKAEGFTLIELLIVIVILGILAAIVVFAVGGITDRGQASACKADKKSIQVAEEAFFAQPVSAGGGNGTYATTLGQLVPKFLSTPPTLHDLTGSTTAAYVIVPVAPCTTALDS